MPFKSKAQQKFMFAAESRGELPKGTARRWAHHTKSIRSLPERVDGAQSKEAAMHPIAILARRSLESEYLTKAAHDFGADPHLIARVAQAANLPVLHLLKLGYDDPQGFVGLLKLAASEVTDLGRTLPFRSRQGPLSPEDIKAQAARALVSEPGEVGHTPAFSAGRQVGGPTGAIPPAGIGAIFDQPKATGPGPVHSASRGGSAFADARANLPGDVGPTGATPPAGLRTGPESAHLRGGEMPQGRARPRGGQATSGARAGVENAGEGVLSYLKRLFGAGQGRGEVPSPSSRLPSDIDAVSPSGHVVKGSRGASSPAVVNSAMQEARAAIKGAPAAHFGAGGGGVSGRLAGALGKLRGKPGLAAILAGGGALGLGGLGAGAYSMMGGGGGGGAPGGGAPPLVAPGGPAGPAGPGGGPGASPGGRGLPPGLAGALGLGALGLGGYGAYKGIQGLRGRRKRKEVEAADHLLHKAAQMQARHIGATVMNTFLDKVATRLPLLKQASVRLLQTSLSQGETLSTAIKKAHPNLPPEARGVLASKLVKAAASDFGKTFKRVSRPRSKTVPASQGRSAMEECDGPTKAAAAVPGAAAAQQFSPLALGVADALKFNLRKTIPQFASGFGGVLGYLDAPKDATPSEKLVRGFKGSTGAGVGAGLGGGLGAITGGTLGAVTGKVAGGLASRLRANPQAAERLANNIAQSLSTTGAVAGGLGGAYYGGTRGYRLLT